MSFQKITITDEDLKELATRFCQQMELESKYCDLLPLAVITKIFGDYRTHFHLMQDHRLSQIYKSFMPSSVIGKEIIDLSNPVRNVFIHLKSKYEADLFWIMVGLYFPVANRIKWELHGEKTCVRFIESSFYNTSKDFFENEHSKNLYRFKQIYDVYFYVGHRKPSTEGMSESDQQKEFENTIFIHSPTIKELLKAKNYEAVQKQKEYVNSLTIDQRIKWAITASV